MGTLPRVPFTLVQLTDTHIGAPWGEGADVGLAAAATAVTRTLGAPPDAVIVTGDVASTPTAAEYVTARAVLDALDAPVYVLPGNHDDRALMRDHFAFPAAEAGSLSYAVTLGPLRLVALDTTWPGHDGGQLDRARLDWLAATLAEDVATPTLLAVHHPPILTGIRAMDAIGIAAGERAELAAILEGHPQVQVVVAGHVHRAVVGALGTARVLTVPSTDGQLALDLESDTIAFVREPPAFAVHLVIDGQIVSHLQPVASEPAG